ncbi:hypothetical protein EUGRSUZ_H03687 [Eucalyptus grandis]|uniref:Uncharacterized protein n=2 Tax=Eucalyptus grandis TaxID=71139 RepID=A0A059B5P2_EUCGR|nr:hypothetical protein EUGRSUZ_H03687 [Eucalyptus grandis]
MMPSIIAIFDGHTDKNHSVQQTSPTGVTERTQHSLYQATRSSTSFTFAQDRSSSENLKQWLTVYGCRISKFLVKLNSMSIRRSFCTHIGIGVLILIQGQSKREKLHLGYGFQAWQLML